MLDRLLAARVLVVLGKGGVGKSTVSAALAWLAARHRRRTLALECDEHAPMAALLGLGPSLTPRALSPELSAMVLDGRRALEEYLALVVHPRALLSTITASRLYQYFVQAAPGLKELMMLGKVYYESEREGRPWDLLVLDAPASGHALRLLRMPFAARETFGQSTVGREAARIGAMLRDPQLCRVVQVTTPDALAISETLETYRQLSELELPSAAIMLNRYDPGSFEEGDLTRFKRSAAMRGRPALATYVTELAQSELRRAAAARQALLTLRGEVQCPVLTLPELHGFAGAGLMAAMAAELASL